MSIFRVIFFWGLALLNFAIAKPLPKVTIRSPPETSGLHRRGVVYNNVKYVNYFDIGGSKVTWVSTVILLGAIYSSPEKSYNWDSRPGGNTKAWFEYVPMLHSNHPDHTGKWAGDVQAAAFVNKDAPTHLLGFNEPDNCEQVLRPR